LKGKEFGRKVKKKHQKKTHKKKSEGGERANGGKKTQKAATKIEREHFMEKKTGTKSIPQGGEVRAKRIGQGSRGEERTLKTKPIRERRRRGNEV